MRERNFPAPAIKMPEALQIDDYKREARLTATALSCYAAAGIKHLPRREAQDRGKNAAGAEGAPCLSDSLGACSRPDRRSPTKQQTDELEREGSTHLHLASVPLQREKKYGNLTGEFYSEWLAAYAPLWSEYLTPSGSIVIEVGNGWNPGTPTMSTTSLKALLAFQEAAQLHLCQEFICFNPARLPTPAEWVTVRRVHIKDSIHAHLVAIADAASQGR